MFVDYEPGQVLQEVPHVRDPAEGTGGYPRADRQDTRKKVRLISLTYSVSCTNLWALFGVFSQGEGDRAFGAGA